MQLETMGVSCTSGVAVVEFSRPVQCNPIGTQWLSDLRRIFSWIDARPEARAVILHGREHFSAGGDLYQISGFKTNPEIMDFLNEVQSCLKMIETSKFPVIAAVEGYALGGGTELALACDFIVASSQAIFGLPEVKVGVLPGGGGIARLPKLVGVHKAKELVLLGRQFSGYEALRLGLLLDLVPAGDALQRASAVASELADLPPLAVQRAKKLLNAAHDIPLEAGLREEIAASVAMRGTHDHREGLAAFTERRKPLYRGQ
jgi:enoyl-CoA hydratase/carnithine racemase